MSKKELEYVLETGHGDTLVYKLSGWLYGTKSGYGFQEEIRGKVAGGMKRMIVDLSGVQRIDSCGIGILAASIFSAQKAGAGMVLAALPSHIQRMLGLTMFLEHIDHAATVDEALAKMESMNLSGEAN